MLVCSLLVGCLPEEGVSVVEMVAVVVPRSLVVDLASEVVVMSVVERALVAVEREGWALLVPCVEGVEGWEGVAGEGREVEEEESVEVEEEEED